MATFEYKAVDRAGNRSEGTIDATDRRTAQRMLERQGRIPVSLKESAQKASGAGGFGYDPLFVPDGYAKSFAELSADEKNAISHRGRALEEVKRVVARAV